MANTRSRSFDQRAAITGTYITYPPFPSTTVQTALAGPHGTCDDTVGNWKSSNALLIVRQETWLPIYNGTYPLVGTPKKQLINCPSDYHPAEPSPTSVYPALSATELSNLAWSALAETNINVPHVSVPTFIAELRDVPGLIKDWGGSLLRKVAKGHLTWRWALKPMISDLRKMLQFERAVRQRFNWLLRLQQGDRVLKRRASLRSNQFRGTPSSVQLKSVGASIQGTRVVVYTEKVWGTVKWKLDPGTKLPGWSPELFDKAWKLTFGINSHGALSTLWEILPWSWFADWFLGIGTVINATNNTIPLTWGDINIMRTTSAIAQVTHGNSVDLSWCRPSGEHRQSEIRKERRPASPTLPFVPSVLPIIDAGKWSILGSLAVLRGR